MTRPPEQKLDPIPFQDAGPPVPDPLPAGAVVFYHTHGRRQYFGTCKLHLDPQCPHLRAWQPGHVGRGTWPENISPAEKRKYQLGRTLMREWRDKESEIGDGEKCRTCWPVCRDCKGDGVLLHVGADSRPLRTRCVKCGGTGRRSAKGLRGTLS